MRKAAESNGRAMTQKRLRHTFWRQHPELSRHHKIKTFGRATMYPTDVRAAFVAFVKQRYRNGEISKAVAQRITLEF